MDPCYVFPPSDATHATLTHDSGWTAESYPATHPSGREGWAFDIPDGTPNGNGARLTFFKNDKELLWLRGVLYLTNPTGVGLEVDDYTSVKSHVRPFERSGLVRLNRNQWVDDAGPWWPFGTTLMWAIGGYMREGPDRVRQNFQWMFEHGHDCVRILGKVNWHGQSFDPRDPGYALGPVIDLAWECGLRTHLCVTGGGDDPVGAAHAMVPMLEGRQHRLLLIESVNEQNASEDDAVRIAQIMAPLGVPTAVGLGNIGLDAINQATEAAHCAVGLLHEERSTDPARNIRQCWDFRLLHGAPGCTEPQGPASSVAEETMPANLASARFARILCGAGLMCKHTGHGVFGNTYPYNANTPPGEFHSDTRCANLWEAPLAAEQSDAMVNAVAHLPVGCENWSPFNQGHPVDIPAGNVSKLYGCIDGGRFCEIAIGAYGGPVTFRAVQPCHLTIVNIGTAAVLVDDHFAQGARVTVDGLFCYGLIGTLG